MRLSDEEIKHLESLAKIKLDKEARNKLRGQLSDIIGFVQKLRDTDTSHHEDITSRAVSGELLRKDGFEAELEREAVLAEAPDRENGYFKVPPVIEKE